MSFSYLYVNENALYKSRNKLVYNEFNETTQDGRDI